jgi:hypothetical protein
MKLTLINHYPPASVSTVGKRCIYCGHRTGAYCQCLTCPNHPQGRRVDISNAGIERVLRAVKGDDE